MSDKEKIEMKTQQWQTSDKAEYKDFLHIRESRDKLNVPEGVNAKIYKGVTIGLCVLHGGRVETQAGVILDKCIINAGELCLFTGTKVNHLLAHKGCTLIVRSGVILPDFKQTGMISSCYYPGTRVNSPYKKISRTR